jgi:outer membrane protein assembly factor BamE (lipoprotein component of BamABCDE complex)
MNTFLRIIPVLLVSGVMGLLGGCAIPSAIKPGATADELTQKLGKPTEVRPGPQGGESWDYVYGPAGVQTWRFDLDRSRVVSGSTQLLTPERLQRVVAGVTTQEEVKTLLGKPREIVMLGGETVWEWRVAMNAEYGVYVVRFGPNGVATGYNILRDFKYDGDRDAGR